MISYAQNAEDVVLDRVLPFDKGFYVDIGASSPDAASVTRHFYEKGWSGVNIEPRRDAWEELEARRPRDLNLPIAVGSGDGMTTLYHVVEDPDLSTIDPADLAFLTSKGYTYRAVEVQVKSLSSVLAITGVTTVDFLKIDAEGAEEMVLEGLDLSRWRPRVIVVEAIRPWSRDRTDHEWRGLLESNGYREGLFDGVNLFFAPLETPAVFVDLVPASPLDHYVTAEVVALREALEYRETEVLSLRAALDLRGNRSHITAVKPRRSSQFGPVPPCTRFAVVGSPHSGGDRIADALAGALGVEVIRSDHPAVVDWAALPDRAVVDLPWYRSAELVRRLQTIGARAVSPARHPFGVLAEAYGDRPREGFLQWARSDEARRLAGASAEWWSTPATVRVRYEELEADPEGSLERLLWEVGLRPRTAAAAGSAPTVPSALPAPSVLPTPLAPGPLRLREEEEEFLDECYRDVAARLGYLPRG